MCISKPQRVLSFKDGKAIVEFNNEKRTMKSPMPLNKGEYVICQQGFVVKRVPEKMAKDMLKEWKEMSEWM